MRAPSLVVMVSLLALMAVGSSVVGVGAAQSVAYLYISPPVYVAQNVGDYYGFYVNVLNVQNLSTVRFTVSFNASTLQFVNVTQQAFFPSSPASSFQYQVNVSLGLLAVNMSLAKGQSPLNGNGPLVSVFFKVNQKPSSCIISTMTFTQVTLLDPSAKPIVSDSVGATCFWKAIGPDPPGQGLIIESTNSAWYRLDDIVILYANVTFGGSPVANKLVAFQVLNPVNNTIVIGVAPTNAAGIAAINFTIPNIQVNIGTWTEFSNVEIDQVTYSDVIYFQVYPPRSSVGGFSFAVIVPGNSVNPAAPYAMVLLTMILGFVFVKRTRFRPRFRMKRN